MVKNLPAMRETWVRSLGWENPLEEGRAQRRAPPTARVRVPQDRRPFSFSRSTPHVLFLSPQTADSSTWWTAEGRERSPSEAGYYQEMACLSIQVPQALNCLSVGGRRWATSIPSRRWKILEQIEVCEPSSSSLPGLILSTQPLSIVHRAPDRVRLPTLPPGTPGQWKQTGEMEAISSTEEAGLPLKLVLAARARPITAKSSNRAFVTDTLPSLNCHPLPTASFQRRGSLHPLPLPQSP